MCTFLTANSMDSISKHYNTGRGAGELLITTGVNMGLSLIRDSTLARLSGRKVPKIAKISYLFWFVRDLLCVGAGFSFPPFFSKIF